MKNSFFFLIPLSCIALSCCNMHPNHGHMEALLHRLPKVHNDPARAVVQACSAANIPCGIEMIVENLSYSQDPPIDLENPTTEEVLDAVVREKQSFQWSIEDGLVNVAPKNLSQSDPLMRRLAHFIVVNKYSDEAIAIAARQAGFPPSNIVSSGFAAPSRPICAKISLDLRGLTLRQVFNRIAAADGKITWSFVASDINGRVVQYGAHSYRGDRPFEQMDLETHAQ
jgi:hypothetical protein